MKKALFVFVSIAFLSVFSFSSGVFANDNSLPQKETTEINSFELFWPIVAGRTMGDPLYWLKSFKENVRGWLIFGKPQKADYAVFLATKRIVEAEKLINENKVDLAKKTLDKAMVQLEKAEKNLDALPEGTSLGDVVHNMNKRLDNLETFLPWLSMRHEELKANLQSVLEKVKVLSEKV
jgi:hypothetical protein